MSTRIPARALDQERELGSLAVGTVADVVVSSIDQGEYTYMDVLHETRTAKEKINPETVIYSGNIYDGDKYETVEMTQKHDATPGIILSET